MKIAVLGTKMVGQAIATKLIQLGQEVTMGSRSASNDSAAEWLRGLEPAEQARAKVDTFAEAAKGAELLMNCTGGKVSLDVLSRIAPEDRDGKILVDLANPLDFDHGMPPTLSECNTTSLAERIQAAFPQLRVVKTLNTVTAQLMVNPALLAEPTTIFVSGNDQKAKDFVKRTLLQEAFGWQSVLDLGDITTARGPEMYLSLWLRMWGAQGTANFNVKLVRE